MDNYVVRVEIDDVDRTGSVSGPLLEAVSPTASWMALNTISFESNAVKLRVCGYDAYPPPRVSDYTAAAGFLMACDDGGVGTTWGDVVSDTSSGWSAVTYSDATFVTATSSPRTPVKSRSGFFCQGCGLSSTSRTPEKIWQGVDAQYVCFTLKP